MIHNSIVLCNFGAPEQELFLMKLKDNSGDIRFAMGVGGSFDYLTGKQKRAPKWLRVIGLEWLWRLILQPKRFKRIWNATVVFLVKSLKKSHTCKIRLDSRLRENDNARENKAMQQQIRVRFAPSPTGYLHIGGLRTALYNYLFAKKNGGAFILRIEDTDQKRFVPGAIEKLIESLNKVNIKYDEGVFLKTEIGTKGPYIQSKRLEIYKKYANELVANGKAYHCFCPPERLEQVRAKQATEKKAPKYDKHCLSLSSDAVKKKLENEESHVLRLNVFETREDVIFNDIVRGQIKINARDIDDQVLMKSDGFPTYHLASVVDDHLMEISHVIRGEEWLPSTPKHILLYEAFGWDIPEFAHLPLILNPDKSKLSKRQGDVAVEDYLAKGYLPEALINFVALLGWNQGQGSTQEIFSLQELEEIFDLHNVHKAGAVFDLRKLDWMNGEYIKKLSPDELYERILAGGFLDKALIKNAPAKMQTHKYLKKVLAIERERMAKLSDIGESNQFFFASELSYDVVLLNWKQNVKEMTKEALTKAEKILQDISEKEWTRENLEKILMSIARFAGATARRAGGNKGDFLWPLRVALTGAEKSPSPFEVAWVLGKNESLKRVQSAIKRLE
jgi:glutamyl-tRNA synthetase